MATEQVSFDSEKSSVEIEYVIFDHDAKKYYKATLGRSQWYLQDEYNAKEIWREVVPYEVKTTHYRYI